MVDIYIYIAVVVELSWIPRRFVAKAHVLAVAVRKSRYTKLGQYNALSLQKRRTKECFFFPITQVSRESNVIM